MNKIGCLEGSLKVFVVVFNGILMVFGVLLLGVSIWSLADVTSLSQGIIQVTTGRFPLGLEFFQHTDTLFILSWLGFAIGILFIILSFLAVYGAIMGSRPILISVSLRPNALRLRQLRRHFL
ncbi:hypothetical protein Ciccas_012634 [Cichlidogyrus casuarinus]|uniref:Uncharacterized protein n=1 Tax=Cichlidogyrus casuarinus TaxID=1844966 RepID=A0ABD2PNI6_9PLAT